MEAPALLPPHLQAWVHPQLNIFFRSLQHILPNNIIQNIQIYITINLPLLTISYQISLPVINHLSQNQSYLEMSHVSPQVPGKLDSSHPIIYLHQVWIRSKLPHNTHIQYYLRHCTLISILSALENIIWLTPPCDIIHQSWCSHTRPLSPLRNDPSQLSFYHDDHYASFIVHNSHQKRTHPSPSKMNWVNYLFFNFWIIFLIEHAKKTTRLLIYDLYPSEYIYGYKTPQSM